MAGIQIQSTKMAIWLVSGVVAMMISSAFVATAEEATALPPLSQDTHDFLEECAAKIQPPVCGEKIRLYIFEDGSNVSDECCKTLLNEGKACHDKFVEATAPFYAHINLAKVEAKSLQLWNYCAATRTAISANDVCKP